MANICWLKRDIDNQQGHWKVRRVSYVVAEFHELWSTNDLKLDRIFYLRSLFFLSQFIAHPVCSMPHSNSKWNSIGFVCSSDLKPQMLSRRAALSGNIYIAVIATFSSILYVSSIIWRHGGKSCKLDVTVRVSKHIQQSCMAFHTKSLPIHANFFACWCGLPLPMLCSIC